LTVFNNIFGGRKSDQGPFQAIKEALEIARRILTVVKVEG
jgi:hypothetical protein